MLRLLFAAALLGAGQPRLVYEPEADFYGADEITVEVTTDADADNASTVIPIVVSPVDDAATLLVTGSATAEAGGAHICVLANATINDVDGGDSIVELVVRADRGSIALKPTAADINGVRLISEAPLTLEATPLRLTALLRTCGITYEPPRTPGPDLVTASVDGGPPSSIDIDVAPAAPPVLLGCGSAPLEVKEGASTSIPLVFEGGVDDYPVMKLAWSSPSVVSILNGTDSLLAVATPTSIVLSSPSALRRMVASQLLVYKGAKRGTHAIRFELTGLSAWNGTSLGMSEATCSVRVSPTNAKPSFLGDMFWKGNEDALISVRGIVVTDSDGDDLLIDLTARTGRLLLAAKPVGINIATAEGDGTWPANSTSLVLRGGVDALNRALDGLRFEPPRDFSGEASIDMRVVDEAGASDEATAIISVEEVADAPQFLAGEAISARDGAVHAREDEVMRLGGSSHGWPATGGRGEVVSLAPNDLGSNDAVLSISIDHFTAFLLRNDTWLEHGVAVLQSDVLRLSGTVQSLSAALADITLIPSPNWHGPARLHLNLTESDEELAATTIELDIEGVQDAPVLIGAGPYEVEEDTYLPLAISLVDPDYEHAEAPDVTCSLRVSARSGALRIVGGKAFAALSGAVLEEDDVIVLQGSPSSITSTLAKLEYVSAPDWSGDDVVDVVADDGGGFPVSDPLVATLQIPIRVHAVADAPRVAAPPSVLYDEATKGVALGRNGTKTETPIPGVSVYDPDSEVVSVTLTATSGRVKVVSHIKDVEFEDETESPSSYARTLTLRANQSALNAALSTLTWVPDDQIAGRDGYISGRLRVEASDGVLTNATSISIRAAAYNDPPLITGAVEDVLTTEDSDWVPLPSLEASDEDDRALTLQVSARSEGALEVHSITTSADITTRTTAVHVVRVVNASWNASQVERGAFRLVVDLSHVEGLPEGAATRATTEPIAFDAVARTDDERTGSAGERLRERDGLNPDLSHQSVESKLLSLPNVRKAGLRVTVSREDYAAFGSQHYDRYDSLGGARYVDDYEVRRSYYKSVGSRWSRPAPLQSGHEWRITFEGATPEAASAPIQIHADASIWDGLTPSVETVRHANAIHGMFTVQVKGYSTTVAHNASSTDLERALMSLPSVTAVLVSRSGESESGGFEWHCTFMESSVDLRVDGTHLRGEHASITSSLVRARFGDPQLHKIDVSHDPHLSIHALSLKRGRNFVRIGLDTRNCSIYAGGSHYLANGSLRFTRPIPRIAPGSVEEEVDGMAEFNRGLDHAYPPHSLPGPNSSVEAHLLSLPNWGDLGPEASVSVSKHDNAGTTVWRVTFVNTPHALPLLRVLAVEGNDNRNLDVLALMDPEEDVWDLMNTSITRSRSLANRAGLKSRLSDEASAALEREASQLQGTWRICNEDLLYFSAAGHAADEWRIDPKYRDECDSMRRSSFDENIAFVVSASNDWVPGKTYDCPQGWRWMNSEEALRTFTGRNYGPSQGGRDENPLKKRHDMATAEERVYYSQCGWEAWTYENVQREHFRFSDSHETGLYKAASSPDSRRPDVDLIKGGWQGIELKTKRFAGIVCVADPDSYDVAPSGRELWASDGSPQGTFRAVNSASHSDPQHLCVFDGALFFGAKSEHGRELHRFSKESNEGRGVMRLVADIRRGPDGSDPKYLTSCGNVLWFVANDGLRGDELYASDGGLGYLNRDAGDSANNNVLYEQRGESGTRLAKDIRPGKGSSSPNHFVCLNNVLLFAATSDDTGRELWRAAWSDLTDSTTLVVTRVADVHQGAGSSSPEYLAVLHNKVYFAADDGRVGRELWKTDGTPSGTRLVADARLGSLGSSPRYLTPLDNRLFYVARTPDPADEVDRTIEAPVATRLWATDGTRANTKPVFDTTVMDLDRISLDAGGGALASLKNALYYPARRGAMQLDGGLNGGHASQRKGRPQAFAVHDADDDVLTLVLDVLPREAGGLSLDVAPPPSIEVLDGDLTMDETQTFRGTSARLNLLLADLWFVAAPKYAGAVEIKAEVRDDPLHCMANVTDGCERGENATGVATMRVFVRRQNQAPTVSVVKGPVGASSEGWNRFEGFASIGDPDADDAELGVDASTGLRIEPRLVVTVTAQKGVVSLGATDARLSFIEGTGVDDRRVVVDAPVEALNEALGVVTYACENCELGSDEITVEVDDGGFTGLGGALTAMATVEVSIVRR